MFLINGNPLPLDVPFNDADGVQRPANWLRLATPEEREAIGITEIPDPVRPDDRFYWVSSDSSSSIPKDLDGLKEQWSAQVNQIAHSLLTPTDWMVTRKAETGAEIPADIAAYSVAVRADANENQAALNAATDIESFIAVATALKWPQDPNSNV